MPKNELEGRTHLLRLAWRVSKIVLKLYSALLSCSTKKKPRTETGRDLTLTDCNQVEIIFYMDDKYVIRDLMEVEEPHGRAKKRNFSSSFLNTRREISYLQAAM